MYYICIFILRHTLLIQESSVDNFSYLKCKKTQKALELPKCMVHELCLKACFVLFLFLNRGAPFTSFRDQRLL